MENSKIATSKTRHLSIYEFLEILQLEYLTVELRRKIYPKQKDKAYYTKVMLHKKQKIQDIAVRNVLPSLFTSPEIKQALYRRLFQEKGLPNFVYRDEKDKQALHHLDVENYYAKGAEVKVFCEEQIIIGEIYEVHLDKKVIFIKPRGSESLKPYSMDSVTRII
jgi:hypothetical protein